MWLFELKRVDKKHLATENPMVRCFADAEKQQFNEYP